eukprot:1142092-Pelagomonas_calceolata.AAC.2
MLGLWATNEQMPLPNIRLFRVVTPLQTQPPPVSTLKAILSMTPPGLPLRKLPAHAACKYIKRPNSPALKLKHFSNLHDALRTHMHSKHRLGKVNTKTG